MHMDYKLKMMVVKYPIINDPIIKDLEVLYDNFQQVVKIARVLEKRLKRDGMEEFITRAGMRQTSKEE